MAANRFTIPQFDIDLLNWSNNVNARNDARARQRQQDWNTVYSQAAALGNTIRAEKEAEKARQNAAEQAAIQREFQAAEAQKNRDFQTAQNLANREAQTASNNAMLNKAKLDNMGKAQGEIGVLDAELEKELGTTNNPNDQALMRKIHDAKVANVYARYGLDRPEGTPVPFKPVANEGVEVPNETPAEIGLTNKQTEEVNKEIAAEMKAEMERIKQMKSGKEKQAAMEAYNKKSNGAYGGYTPEDIKKAGFQIPMMATGATVPSDKTDYYKQWYKMTYDPTKGAYVIIGRK